MFYKLLSLFFVGVGFKLFSSHEFLALIFMVIAFLILFINGDRAFDLWDFWDDDF